MNRRAPARLGTACAAIAMITVVGCTAAPPDASDPSTTTSTSTEEFVDMFAGYSQDYEPVATPAELASQSTLVVEGEISTVTDGRTWGSATDDPGANQSVVLNVAISEIHVGSAPEGSGDTVYVEVPSPGNVAFDAYASALPDGLTGVFYLIPAAMDTTDILDPDAGRPAGQPLFQMASPQGLVLGSSDGVLQLIEGDEYPEADLRDFIPESERFPVDPDTTPEPDVPAN